MSIAVTNYFFGGSGALGSESSTWKFPFVDYTLSHFDKTKHEYLLGVSGQLQLCSSLFSETLLALEMRTQRAPTVETGCQCDEEGIGAQSQQRHQGLERVCLPLLLAPGFTAATVASLPTLPVVIAVYSFCFTKALVLAFCKSLVTINFDHLRAA